MSFNHIAVPRGQLSTYFLTFSAFILGFALPTSIALTNMAYGLVILSLLINRDFSYVKALAKRPLFYLPVLMFLLMAVSLLYADNEFGKAMLSKYKKLLYIFPLALFFLQDRKLALTTLQGFVAANVIILFLSVIAWFNLFSVFNIDPGNPTVFHLHITQNFFMAIACLVWLVMIFKTTGVKRIAFTVLLLVGVCNILFMVQGRIGYVAVLVGLGIWLWMVLNNKQRVALIVCGLVGMLILVAVPNKVKDRMMLGVDEIERCVGVLDLNMATPPQCHSSMGLRTEFAYRALKLIKSSPIVGVGVGGFDYFSDDKVYHHVNPHNEYLMQTLQSGVIGLAVFLFWIFFMYRAALRLPGIEKPFFVAIITTYVAGCIFNSFVLDAYEGQLFMLFVAYLAAEMARREKPQS
jgi:O-antigen ligase